MTNELVLTFHGIGTCPEWVAEAERPYWIGCDEFRWILDDVAEQDRLPVVITFDDGNQSDLEIAAPELTARDMKGIFFPCSDRIGCNHYLGSEELRALAEAGFTVGSHGVAHVPWKGMAKQELEVEVGQSKTEISEACGHPVTVAALPFGAYDAATLSALRAAGYEAVYSSDPGLSQSDAWFRRRWSWVAGRDFSIERLARISCSPKNRLISGFKHHIKARR